MNLPAAGKGNNLASHVDSYRRMSELDDLLHSSHVIASEMIHFTQQIGYYINFEVRLPDCNSK